MQTINIGGVLYLWPGGATLYKAQAPKPCGKGWEGTNPPGCKRATQKKEGASAEPTNSDPQHRPMQRRVQWSSIPTKASEPKPQQPTNSSRSLTMQFKAQFEQNLDALTAKISKLRSDVKAEDRQIEGLIEQGQIEQADALFDSPTRKQLFSELSALESAMGAFRDTLLSGSLPEEEALEIAKRTKIRRIPDEAHTEIHQTIAEFHRLTNGFGREAISYIRGRAGRASTDMYGNVYIDPTLFGWNEARAVMFHEMAHNLEDVAWRQRNNQWIAQRSTNNAQVERLSDIAPGMGYGPDEVAVRGDFYSPYIGRFYGPTFFDGDKWLDGRTGGEIDVSAAKSPTEVLSMGIEKFATAEGMVDLYQLDKQHFMWMIEFLEHTRSV